MVDDSDGLTGSEWVPSQVLITKNSTGYTNIRASRLISANWIPIIGGMNYCKIISEEGARKLLGDVHNFVEWLWMKD